MPTVAEKYKFSEVESDGKAFIADVVELCKVHHVANVKLDNVMRAGNKDAISNHLIRALQLIERQHNLIINQRVHAKSYQDEIIKLQSDVIDAQKKEMKQLIESDISTAVHNSVKSSFTSYSAAVKSSITESPRSSPVISQETLKQVAKQVAVEEELTRNVMVFGLPEHTSEQLDSTLNEVFGQLDEKPKFEAARLGKKKDSIVRPVRVVMASVHTAQRILGKSKNLRHFEQYKRVFLAPDRTAEERAKQRELVQQLKKKAEEEPEKRHFIKNGTILSSDRNNLAT